MVGSLRETLNRLGNNTSSTRRPPRLTSAMSSKEDKKAEKGRLAAEKKAAKDKAKADKKVWTRRPDANKLAPAPA